MRAKILSSLLLIPLIGCEANQGDVASLTPISPASSSNNSVKRSADCPDAKGSAEFDTNLALENFCVSYVEKQNGTIEFAFKGQNETSPIVSLAVPHTEAGYVWDYDTKLVLDRFAGRSDKCDMLLSSSDYPPLTITGSDGKKDYAYKSTSCDNPGSFSVKINAINVAQVAGDSWSYEVAARYAPAEGAEDVFIKGRFEVVKN